MVASSRLGRLHGSVCAPSSGRGLATLHSHLQEFERAWSNHPDKLNQLPHGDPIIAMPVDPERIALPEEGGRTFPEDWLPEEKARAFLNWRVRVREEEPLEATPQGCLLISREDELIMRRKLVQRKMAGLVPEKDIPLDSKGNLLLGGLFAVRSKPTKDRLIFDHRPQNWGRRG